MAKALVQVGDVSDDPTRPLPRHGDVILLVDDSHEFGISEIMFLETGKWRLVFLDGNKSKWSNLLGNATMDGYFPLFRNFHLTDDNKITKREGIPSRANI